MRNVANVILRAGAIAMIMLIDFVFGLRAAAARAAGNDAVKMKCQWHFRLVDKDGNVKRDWKRFNMIVLTGFDAILLSVFETNSGLRPAAFGYMAIGGDATAPAEGQTELLAEYTSAPAYGVYQRQAITKDFTAGEKTITLTSVFGPNVGVGTVREAGIFNSLTTGTMLNRILVGNFDKADTDTLTVEVVVNIA